MALIWFKADIDSVIDGMTDFEWPCPAPRHLALIEMQAIIAAGKLDKWSHDRFSRRFKRPVSWCRVLRQAALSQEISRRHADDSQTVRSNDADDKQGRSDNTAISEASVSRSQAGETQEVSSSKASEQHPSCARASSRSKIREDRENKTKTETEEKTPQPPKGADVVSLFDSVAPPSKRTRAPKEPAPFPDRLAEREDAAMWFQVWPSLTKSEQARIWDAVELWDKFTDVFQRIKNATLDDVRAMLQIRSTGIYTLEDLHEGIQGMFVMASEKGGQWVYSSGAFMPRKLFSEKGTLERGRQIWANVTGAKHSKTDDLGRMQHGFTMSEHDFFYGPGGKR